VTLDMNLPPWISALLLTLGTALLAPSEAAALPPSPTSCYAVVTIATVCSLGSCTSTTYVDDYWCSRTPSSDTTPNANNPADVDKNLNADDFRDVLLTTDPCAFQFDEGDRLGTNHGGTNTKRPSHNGVDLQADHGDPVSVVGHGKVRAVGWQDPNDHSKGCGYRMIVDHFNGDVSVYCHLVPNSEEFTVDQWVRSGTVVAAANSTGNSSGDHLHLKYFKNGTTLIEYWDVTGTQPSTNQLNGSC
jgi:hypothetical protein